MHLVSSGRDAGRGRSSSTNERAVVVIVIGVGTAAHPRDTPRHPREIVWHHPNGVVVMFNRASVAHQKLHRPPSWYEKDRRLDASVRDRDVEREVPR